MEKQPLVSVVMATFNEPLDFITQSVESVLLQTYSYLELIIIDDSTNQETIDAIDLIASADARVRVIRRNYRIGFVPALNIGINVAKGKYIARMDGDDVALSCRLAEQVAYMERYSNVAVVGGAVNFIDTKGTIVGERLYPENPEYLALYRSPLAHPSVLMRRDLALNGFLYDENLSKAEDLDLWLRYIKGGYIIRNIPLKVLNYRVPENLADKRGRSQYLMVYKIRKNNFTLKKPFFSVISLLSGFIMSILPIKIFGYIYKLENYNKV